MTKIAASQRQEVADLCFAGKSKAEVAAVYGVSRECIAIILRNLGANLPKEPMGRKPLARPERQAEMVEMYKSGKTQAEVGAAFGLTTGRISQIFKHAGVLMTERPKLGLGRDGKYKRLVSPSSYQAMTEMYKSGKSLEEVGSAYGVTRERVRQILAARGIGRMDGGITIKLFKNVDRKIEAAKAKNERSEARIRKAWGMSLADYTAHVAEHGSSCDVTSPMGKFVQHRKNAKQRGLGWDFTFSDWWRVWQESGKWEQRGRGKQGYVMARWGDGDAPYSVNTVYICTQPENAKDGYIVSPAADRAAKARITRARKLQEVQPSLL